MREVVKGKGKREQEQEPREMPLSAIFIGVATGIQTHPIFPTAIEQDKQKQLIERRGDWSGVGRVIVSLGMNVANDRF